jgi:hypothetical protein
MLEVLIDPLRLEAYDVTAGELINVVQNNNQLIAAGEVQSDQGSFSVKIPSSFDEPRDVYALPVKTNGDRVVTLGDLATINLTFEDREGTARFNGENTVALQVVKRKGYNLIDTVDEVKAAIEEAPAIRRIETRQIGLLAVHPGDVLRPVRPRFGRGLGEGGIAPNRHEGRGERQDRRSHLAHQS